MKHEPAFPYHRQVGSAPRRPASRCRGEPFALAALGLAVLVSASAVRAGDFPVPQIPWQPRHLLCRRTADPPRIDGALDDPAWRAAAWTAPFVDIEGPCRPLPRYATRAKLLWDERNLYIAAWLEEPFDDEPPYLPKLFN